jgi:hypothetical protein
MEPTPLRDEVKKLLKPEQLDDEAAVREANFTFDTIQTINKDLSIREQATVPFNGLSYSDAYVYNQKKAINYAPPKSSDDSEASLGLVHEKIISFCAFFIKYAMKRHVRCYDENGNLVKGMGDIYDLAIEHSYRLEDLKKQLGFIYWETFTQGSAAIQELWDVRTIKPRIAMKDGKEVSPDAMDYTYEFLEGLTYKDGEPVQVRMARSRLLDGRQVIYGNPEQTDVQQQPHITIEEVMSDSDADQVFGSVEAYKSVPKTRQDITTLWGTTVTLFSEQRLTDSAKQRVVHYFYDKANNRFNIFVNGHRMLPMDTPFTLFYPRNNYPLSLIPGERMTGSIYPRAVPMKVKFNADLVDKMLKLLVRKFEQGVNPAILVKGKYTLSKDLFNPGKATHGVNKADYEKADPDNKGVTTSEYNFVSMFRQILEEQTLSKTAGGNVIQEGNPTATEINTAESNQVEKLGYLLDGIIGGYADMAMRRAETIESKYTIKQRETVVDGKKINVYQNFTVSMGGISHHVEFNDEVGGEDYPFEEKRVELFEQAFKEKKAGQPTEFYLANPNEIRERKYSLDIEVKPERIKDTMLRVMELRAEYDWLFAHFPNLNREEVQKEYLDATGRSDKLFLPVDLAQAAPEAAEGAGGPNLGSMGAPRPTDTMRASALNTPR